MSSDDFNRLLTPDTVAELRSLQQGNMPHTCTVTVVPVSGTRVGGALVSSAPVTVLTDAACRLTPRKRPMQEQVSAGQMRVTAQWVLILAAGTELPHGAVAVVTGADVLDGVVWVRSVRIGAPEHSRVFGTGARYACEDVGIGGR